jgi:hypothetical protein
LNDGHPIAQEEEFEMVVLSVGLKPTQETQEMATDWGLT